MMQNNEIESNQNPLSDPYRREHIESNLSKNNFLKSVGEQLIINPKKTLVNKSSHKSIFFSGNQSNKKLKKIYDPYLISACKHAIFKERRELPNYKEIIRNINTEFGIEESEKNNFEIYNDTTIKNKNKLTINIEPNNNNILRSKYPKKLTKKDKISQNSLPKISDRLTSNKKINSEEKKIIDEKEMMRIKKRAEINEKKMKRKRVLLNAIKYLSYNNISVNEYVSSQIFPTKPFELRGSEDFFDAVKFNDINVIKQALEKNDHYLIQFDYFKQTPLHWAAKLGHHEILKIFLEHTKMVNIYDKEYRTPIFLAALNNHKKCVELLLEKGGNAFIKDKEGVLPEAASTDPAIKLLLQISTEKSFNELNEINKKKSQNDS